MTMLRRGEDPALSAFGGLLAVHAHPDDETLWTGGLLAAFAAGGRPVCVVTCTRGERGEVLALPGTTSEGRAGLEGDGPALGAYRETELATALTRLAGGDGDARVDSGPTAVVGRIEHAFLDTLPDVTDQASGTSGGVRYEDSGMAWVAPGVAGPAADSPPTAFARVPLDEPARRLAALVRARRPAVVATYESGGGYGHPDHVRAHQVTVRALELAADPAWRPDGAAGVADAERTDEPWAGAELWQVVVPAAEVHEARSTLAALPEARSLASAHALTFANPDDVPPNAILGAGAWSAGRQETGTSDRRSPDKLPITRADGIVRVDVRGVLGDVVRGLRAHATQVQHATALVPPEGTVAGWYALSNGVLTPILTAETYLVSEP